jgi:hypothetical protein
MLIGPYIDSLGARSNFPLLKILFHRTYLVLDQTYLVFVGHIHQEVGYIR